MSNIFITDIVGTIGIPSDDTELAAATATLDGLLSPILNFTYDRLLAWVEDSGGPGGAEGVRTLNCLIEKFTYMTEECPSETFVDTLSGVIETTLEATAPAISSIGVQQYHLVQVIAYALWSRDTSGGFLYPTTATDDVVVGPSGTPTGKWFNDGDLVLGGNAMSGTEKIRVVGSARIEGNLTMTGLLDGPTGLVLEEQSATPYDPTATSQGTLWVRDDNPNVLVFTDNAGTDTVLGGASPWTSATGVIYPTTLTDTVAINSTTMSSAADEYFFVKDTDETNATRGVVVELEKDGAGTKTSWTGIEVNPIHTGANNGETYEAFSANLDFEAAGAYTLTSWTAMKIETNVQDASAALGTFYGVHLEAPTGSGSITTSYGVYLDSLGATNEYGIYQVEANAYNWLAGNTLIGGLSFITPTNWTLLVQNTDDTGSQVGVEAGLNKTGTSTMASFACYSTAPTVASGTVTTLAGVDVDSPSGAGAITTIYGIYIDAQQTGPAAAATAWAIYQSTSSDLNYFAGRVGINETSLLTAMLDVRDDIEDSATWGGRFRLDKNGAGTKTAWIGVEVQVDHSAEEDAGTYTGFMADLNFTPENSTLTTAYGFRTQLEIQESTSECTTWYGVRVESNPGSGDITNAYGLYIDGQSGATLSYGIYQQSTADDNYLAGQVGIGAVPIASTKAYVQAKDEDSLARGLQVSFNKAAITGQNSFTGIRSTMSYTGNQAPAPCYGFSSEYNFSPSGAQTMTGLYGYASAHTTGANATVTALVGFYAGSDDLDGAIGSLYGFRAGAPSISGSVTNAYAFYADDQGGGVATNAYGVYIADQDGVTLSYGIYQAGTDDLNYLAGRTGINQSSLDGTVYLHITDTEDDGTDVGAYVYLPKDGSGSSKVFTGFKTGIWHTGTGTGSLYVGFDFDLNLNNSSASIDNVYGFRSSALATDGTITNYRGVSIDGTDSGGVITNAYGVYIASMEGTTLSYGIYQADPADLNYFAGNIGINDVPTSGNYIQIEDTEDLSTRTGVLVTLTKDGSSNKVNHFSFESVINHTGSGDAADYRGLDIDIAINNASATVAKIVGVNIDLNHVAGTITNNYGIVVDIGGFAGSGIGTNYGVYIDSYPMTSNTFGIYQANEYDMNYFNGRIGIKDSTPSYPLDVNGDVNVQTGGVYRHNGSSGQSGTYTFGGGSTGDIATMTFAGGILVGVTLVP